MENDAEQSYDTNDSDVLLDVPVLKVDEIELEVDDLRARVSLQAEVLDLLKLNVGADAELGRVHLNIKGVEAQALLKVRLDNVAAIIERVLKTIDQNPQILEHITSSVGSAVREVSGGAGEAVGALGRDAGQAVRGVGEGAGRAVGDAGEGLGKGVGKAAERTGEGAGHAVADAGSGVSKAVRGTGEGAGRAVGEAGAGAGRAAEHAGEGAGEAEAETGRAAGRAASGAASDAGSGDRGDGGGGGDGDGGATRIGREREDPRKGQSKYGSREGRAVGDAGRPP